MKLYEQAIILAVHAHEGQFDKAGFPYVLHPLRVAESLETEEEMIVGVLHDVVEDTDITLSDIAFKFGFDVAEAVDSIAKRENEPYRDYLDRVRRDPIALRVKLADMTDNSSPARLASLSVEKQVRLAAKYARGRHYLLTGEWYDNKDLDRVIKAGYSK